MFDCVNDGLCNQDFDDATMHYYPSSIDFHEFVPTLNIIHSTEVGCVDHAKCTIFMETRLLFA
jgi:hypothetical protein